VTAENARPSPQSLVEAFSEVARRVHTSEDYEGTLRLITETAARAIAGCDAVSLTLLERSGPVTRAATDQLARAGDQIQYEENEGPCLDAAMELTWVSTPDLAADPRWPRSSTRIAADLGVGSMFSCRLTLDAAPNHTLGGLNLYSMRRDGFAEQDQMMAILLASLGAVVIDASRQQAQLRAAIQSRQVIGEAIGILRAQSNVTSEEAFTMLTAASQRMNVKLRDIARQIRDGDSPAAPRPGPTA
jgi:transcriptional regulator with GAF, ATPase, and Fis domain